MASVLQQEASCIYSPRSDPTSSKHAWPIHCKLSIIYCTVRKITPAGQVSTLAGVAGLTGYQDGAGAAVRINFPDTMNPIATDGAGNVYISDSTNSTIRKITAGGVVSTVIGDQAVRNRKKVTEGVLPAGLNTPMGVYVNAGNLYITDENAVLKINGLP